MNLVQNVGWCGWLPINPRVNTILTTDDLATITEPGWMSADDAQIFPQQVYQTDLWDIEYDYDEATQSQTYARFTTSIDEDGVITLALSVSQGNVNLPVVSNNIAIFNGTDGAIGDSGVSLLGGSFTKVPRIASGSYGAYTVGNFLIAYDTSGNITGGNGNDPTQTNVTSSTGANITGATFAAQLTATTVVSGLSRGLRATATMVGMSAGQVYGMDSSLTATGTLGASAIVSGARATAFLPATVINSAQVTAGLDIFGSLSDNPSGTLTNCSVRRLENPSSATIGQMFDLYGSATYAFRFDTNGTPGYLSTPAGATPSGTLRNIAIYVQGVGAMKLLGATVWS